MTSIEKIKAQARSLDGCAKVEEIKDCESAIKILFSPQGREFAVKNAFPSLETFRGIDGLDEYGVFVDRGEIQCSDRYDMAFVGNCKATIKADKNAHLYHILVCYGAECLIEASKYAVVTVSKIGECAVNIVNDGTARVYEEGNKNR